jgi:predicted RNA-binding Zn-ribbon protein involved in translation (DUF1610 family)
MAYTICARCGYALRGLPANYACPECGLRYDERCAIYRMTHGRRDYLLWLLLFGLLLFTVANFRHLRDLSSISAFDLISLVGTGICMIGAPIAIASLTRRYRQGFCVAITTDGLFVRLPNSPEKLIPWSEVGAMTVKVRLSGHMQIVTIVHRPNLHLIRIGGFANVFPRRADVEQFAQEVQTRREAAYRGPDTKAT